MSRSASRLHGVVVVDKPGGMSSHDVVQRIRRAAGTGRVGHAGTLDPLATGVLVVMIGEGTKLGPWLTAGDKRYRARVQLGVATDSLDADGQVVAEAPLPAWWPAAADAHLEPALAAERARREQLPPAVSAIKVGGRPAYARARRGEAVELAARPVAVRELRLLGLDPSGWLEVEVSAAKGYYVRALARDLGAALDCPAHLTALRRLAAGAFDLAGARPLADLASAEAVAAAIVPVGQAASLTLPVGELSADGVGRARTGKILTATDFTTPPPADVEAAAWLDAQGQLVAVGAGSSGKHSVLRGFSPIA